jgi:hypothetical protein
MGEEMTAYLILYKLSWTNEIKECVIVTDKESFDIYDYMIERYNDSNIEINIRRYDTVHMVREGAE